MNQIIAVDVDLTVVESGKKWVKWICENFDTGTDPNSFFAKNIKTHNGFLAPSIPYDIQNCFNIDADLMEFWKTSDLYDDLSPIEGSVEVLKKLHDDGFDIIFVSYCMPEHMKSKWDFIDKYFPFNAGKLATKDKRFINCDYIIDDRLEFVIDIGFETTKILYNTPYEQGINTCVMNLLIDDETMNDNFNFPGYRLARDWNYVYDIIKGLK